MFEFSTEAEKPSGISALGDRSQLALSPDLQGNVGGTAVGTLQMSVQVTRPSELRSLVSGSDVLSGIDDGTRQFLVERLINPQLESLRENPEPASVVSAAIMLLTVGQPQQALDVLSRVSSSGDYWVRHYSALCLWQTGLRDEAVAALQALASEYVDDVRPLHALGRLWLLDGKAEAWTVLERAAAISSSADVFNDAATAAIQLRHFTQAIKLLRKALVAMPENSLALNNMGVCAVAQGDTTAAERYFRSAVRYDRNCLPAIHNLAESFIRRSAFEDADEFLDEHLRRHPDDFQAKERLAWTRFSRGKIGQALELLDEVNRQLAGRDPAILNNLAVFHEAKFDFAKAVEYFRKAIAINSTAVNIRENLAGILAAQGRWDEIVHVLPGTLAVQSAKAAILLGNGLHYTHRTQEAIEWLTRYMVDDARNPRVIHFLGYLLIYADDLEKAVSVLQDGATRFPTDLGIVANLAYALLKAGRLGEARRLIEPCLHDAEHSNEPMHLCLLASWGLLNIRQGRYETGMAAYGSARLRAVGELRRRMDQKILLEEGRHLLSEGLTREGEAKLRQVAESKIDAEFTRDARALLQDPLGRN